ncbi:MAG: glycosyltransferase family 2 protein [Candidatus Rokubacteria bacterium]|nr:glycosyltransferase family 2 protein [Candidatus Rokubacteria bacterium]
MRAAVELSVILPVYNEAESVPALWRELEEVLPTLAQSAEVIFVDDGSTDGSAEAIRAIVKQDPRARLVRLAANAGLTAAFHAGFEAAQGRTIVTMDSDLQSDPRDIARLLAHLGNYDAAVGWRQRRHDPWLKRVSSRIANAIRNAATAESVRDSACSLRAMRRECVDAIPPYNGMHRFVPTLLRMAGYRVVEVPVNHRPRRFGGSKYGIRNRAFRAFVDLLVVRWMMTRRLRYEVVEEDGAGAGR